MSFSKETNGYFETGACRAIVLQANDLDRLGVWMWEFKKKLLRDWAIILFTCWPKALVLMNSTSLATPVSADHKAREPVLHSYTLDYQEISGLLCVHCFMKHHR